QTFCSDGEICCQLQSSSYGCCPLHDYNHCCPYGYKCNIEQNKCEKDKFIPWFRKKSSFK
ncbi:unnamed protein product, partial [Rotaria sordida]